MARPKGSGGLTQKMKNFCYAYARCGSATDAYLEAYDTTNHISAVKNGSLLLQRDDIQEFIQKINRPIINKITSEREKKRQIIWDRINICLEKGDETAIARYMDILNKMDAEYVNINRNIDDTGEKLSELTPEQLKELIGTSTEESTEE